ncbi:hypothetical protein RB213_000779 [Colletotrichum asianum]|uniref:Uncharacterized protein n=1 Tax=Colletotrichum asianum TaxID=702518 RepID=A0A8H3ZXI9_9PEZI|nr:hypothetical protein GQ607_000916 [Colletotrichum asianum]
MNQYRFEDAPEAIIGTSIWGFEDADRPQRLQKFFDQCTHERFLLSGKDLVAPNSAYDIASSIRGIKSNPSITKADLCETTAINAAVLDSTMQLMLMTTCKTDGISLGSSNTFKWRNNETAAGFLDRVYARVPAGPAYEQLVNVRNLRAYALTRYAGVKIRATEKLSDHLYLIYGDDYKTLLVFSHRSFLEYGLERLENDRDDLNHSTTEALTLGCLNPGLIVETLKTLDVLFPSIGDKRSREILKKWVAENNLDGRLLDNPTIFSNNQPPKDLQGLYEQYPYWGRHLARLLREADDPTPVTWWQKYTERGRSPRRMFECAMAALLVTAISAFIATALAAVQVWIAYCDWESAPSRSWCPSKS